MRLLTLFRVLAGVFHGTDLFRRVQMRRTLRLKSRLI